MALTKIDDRGLKTPIDLIDNEKIRLGTGNDLELYHDGSNSYIKDAGTGDLYIYGDNYINFANAAGTENKAKFITNGAVELYHDNAKKLETSEAGIGVTDLDDNSVEVRLTSAQGLAGYLYANTAASPTGTLGLYTTAGEPAIQTYNNGAVELYHNNVKTFETHGKGITVQGPEGDDADILLNADEGDDNSDKWRVRANTGGDLLIQNYGGGAWDENIKCIANGGVKLYHDDSLKFETTSVGAKVTGRLTLDGGYLHVSGSDLYIDDSRKAYFGNSADLEIYHDGTSSILKSASHPLAYYATTRHHFLNGDGSENLAVFTIDGSCDLYHNGTKKFETADFGSLAYTIKPYDDNAHDLGASDQRWDDVYATNGTIQTSDRNAKKDIVKSDLGLTFINAVEPVSYKFKTGSRTHYGVIAQDLETVLNGKDFAGLTKDTETGNYGLRYTELISPLIKAVQELSAEVNTLKTEIAALKAA